MRTSQTSRKNNDGAFLLRLSRFALLLMEVSSCSKKGLHRAILCFLHNFSVKMQTKNKSEFKNLNISLARFHYHVPSPPARKDGRLDALSPASAKKKPKGYIIAPMCTYYHIITVLKSYSACLRAAEGCGFTQLADTQFGANKCSASPVASRTHPHRLNSQY